MSPSTEIADSFVNGKGRGSDKLTATAAGCASSLQPQITDLPRLGEDEKFARMSRSLMHQNVGYRKVRPAFAYLDLLCESLAPSLLRFASRTSSCGEGHAREVH